MHNQQSLNKDSENEEKKVIQSNQSHRKQKSIDARKSSRQDANSNHQKTKSIKSKDSNSTFNTMSASSKKQNQPEQTLNAIQKQQRASFPKGKTRNSLILSPSMNANETRARSGFSARDDVDCKEIKPAEDQLEKDFVHEMSKTSMGLQKRTEQLRQNTASGANIHQTQKQSEKKEASEFEGQRRLSTTNKSNDYRCSSEFMNAQQSPGTQQKLTNKLNKRKNLLSQENKSVKSDNKPINSGQVINGNTKAFFEGQVQDDRQVNKSETITDKETTTMSEKRKRDSMMSISPAKTMDSAKESSANQAVLLPPKNKFQKPNQFKQRWEEQESDVGDTTPIVKLGGLQNTELDPPLPILPKALKLIDQKVDCPIKTIIFKKLKEFKFFADQARDKLGEGGDMSLKRRPPENVSPAKLGNQIQLSIEQSRLIQNIVYLRDLKILDHLEKNINQLTQKDVFNHENYLDIKKLIRERETSEKMNDHFPESIMRAKRALQTEKSFTGIAKTLEELSNGGFIEDRGDGSACYKLMSKEDRTLLFESRFESGNLFLATKVSDQEYDCLMQNDINTHGHTQWFYFRVQNTRAGLPVKFNILNYNKGDSMFNYGMKVTVYSEKKAEKEQLGWHRSCTDIAYFQNQIRKDFSFTKYYHTATFTYTFDHDDDTVFLAYCFPYTYTDLVTDLNTIERDPRRRKYINRTILCKTIAGINCELVTITETSSLVASELMNETKDQKRKGVIISSRVHPGETVGSFMMRGILFFLTDPDNKEAMLLRQNFVFKIIPMLNPDGVINGNYRCSLAGCDLNRRWKFPSKMLQPEVYHCKKLIKQVHSERQLTMYCDLHGHSRKPNVFMYGCNTKAPEECRIFPLLLSKISPMFEFKASKFGVQKSKEATARVAMFKELKNVPLIYTMESTFSGMTINDFAGQHVDIPLLEMMGRDLVRTLLVHQNIYLPQELRPLLPVEGSPLKVKKFSAEQDSKNLNEDAATINRIFLAELRNNKELVKQGEGDSTSGSDSEPSEDNLEPAELIKNLPTVDKNLSQALKKQQNLKKMELQNPRVIKSPNKLDLKNTQVSKRNEEDKSPKKARGQVRLFEIKEEKKENETPTKNGKEPAKPLKPKPEMVDAVTQTERSDYHILKMRALKKQLQKTQVEAAEAAKMQNKAVAEEKSKEVQILQLRLEKLQLEDPKVSAAPRSGVDQPSNDYHQVVTNPQNHPPTIQVSSSSVREMREPKDVVFKSNVVKIDSRPEQFQNQQQNRHPQNIQVSNHMISNYITSQQVPSMNINNPYWAQNTPNMPNNFISTERNKAHAYFSQNGNPNQGTTKLITPQMLTQDNRNQKIVMASSAKNAIPPQRSSQLSQGPAQTQNLMPNSNIQIMNPLRPQGKSSSQPQNPQQNQNKFMQKISQKTSDQQINFQVPEISLATPQKLVNQLNGEASYDLSLAGRYASLQQSQQIHSKQIHQPSFSSGSMPGNPQKKISQQQFNNTMVTPGNMLNMMRNEQIKTNIMPEPFMNYDEAKNQNKIQTKSSQPLLNQGIGAKVVTIGALPEVGNNNSVMKDPSRHGVQHQANCNRPAGKIQIGSTFNTGFITEGKKPVPANKLSADRTNQGDSDSNGGFLPLFQARKS